jgi:hypothetical protein
MVRRLATPRRATGSYVMLRSLSVTAPFIRFAMISGESVIRILEAGFGADLDIF